MNIFREDLSVRPEIKVTVPIKKYMMCLNESELNPLQALSEELHLAIISTPLNRYIHTVTAELKAELAAYIGHGVTAEQILFGNGVDEMLYFLFTSVRETAQCHALSIAPSYFDYQTYSGSVGLQMRFLDLSSDFNFSVTEYLEMLADPHCKLGIICYPNNPTGNLFPDKKIINILQSTEKPIIIDETYFEFSGQTFADMIAEFPHIIITRSFSKSFSAAGLRFGYIVSSPQNIALLNKVIPVFNCSILTQTIALTLLKHREVFAENNKKIIQEKNKMLKEMQEYPQISVYPSYTNFLIFSIGNATPALFEYLAENDISVRPVWGHPLLKNHLRVTVCDNKTNNVFLQALGGFLRASAEKVTI